MLLPLLILLTPLPLLAQNAPPPPPSPRTWDSTLAPPTPAGPFLTARPTWVPSDIAAPPPPGAAPTDAGRWSSIYESLLSAGKIPSTLTAAPWPTGSYGPGQGPYPGPGRGGKPGGGPGGWGANAPRPSRRPSLWPLKLRPLLPMVHPLRLAQRPLDLLVGRLRVPGFRLARLDGGALGYVAAVGELGGLHGVDDGYVG
ncbi:hypothetical protein PTNB85_07076 [Pyrenophora teres f. teres]|nr:hypothetical protein HRS9139_07112 [Pyrenophora teres f. teres]KAE8830489.1 hypothetical protein PTNB85_07076 [Pyrenophora teres f. teres]KAE8857511.1 hypothetical protein PTNB29_08578 [Pyrenophora teres f. teres]